MVSGHDLIAICNCCQYSRPMTVDDELYSEKRERIRLILFVLAGALFVSGALALFAAIFAVYVWPRPDNSLLSEIVHGHFKAVVGLPMAAAASFVIVWVLSVSQGRIEFEAWGVKFRGAAGPVAFWVLVYLSIITSINVSW